MRQAINELPLARLVSDKVVTLDQMIEDMEVGLKQSLAVRRTDLRALNLLLGEIADRFDGEDPLRPLHRQGPGTHPAALRSAASQLYAGQEVPPVEEPNAADLKETRDHLNRGKRLFSDTVA